MAGRKNVLSSLVVYSEDSESESESESKSHGEAGVEAARSMTVAGENGGLVSETNGKDDFSPLEGDRDGHEEGEEENSRQSGEEDSETETPEAEDPKEFSGEEKRDPQELVASFSARVRNLAPDEIKVPPEPPGKCPQHLQDKIQKLYERKIKEGMDMNYIIQRNKAFRNPSIYEKLIQYCSIDELGTNYPNEMFDPLGWSEDSYYEALVKAQDVLMDKLEKAKKERTKIEFVTGTKKGIATNEATTTTSTRASAGAMYAQKRRRKWDSAIPVPMVAQPTILTRATPLPDVVTVTTSASGSKTTVISAVGTIVKKARQW